MAFRLSRAAERDLLDILVHGLAEFGVETARDYQRGLTEVFSFLAAHPRIARERAEIRPPVRAHRYRSHLVLYDLDGDDIVILRIRHSREDWQHAD